MAGSEIDEDNIFAFTKAGIIFPTVSGSLSFLSSCLIMITILRSKQNTPYHRQDHVLHELLGCRCIFFNGSNYDTYAKRCSL